MMYESFAGGALCFRIFNGTNQFGCSSKNNLDLGLRIYNLKTVGPIVDQVFIKLCSKLMVRGHVVFWVDFCSIEIAKYNK